MDAITAAVRERGPITFAEFMDIALYGPGGFYEHPPVGPEGDFITSPHVHPVFGELLAETVRAAWTDLGALATFRLIEQGAGDGTLLRQVMDAAGDLPLRVTAVERSAGARATLEGIEHVAVAAQVPSTGAGLVVAHELFDNLGFRRVRGTADGPKEVRITVTDGRATEILIPTGDLAHEPLGPGDEVVVPVGAIEASMHALGTTDGTHRYLLAIDYGADDAPSGQVHGYRSHRVIEDVLRDPGQTDITAGVHFGALRRALAGAGFQVFPTVSQREALSALGFEAWFRTQLERQGDLLNTGRGADAVRLWEGRNRAAMLVDPVGLGRFRWFVASSPGLPEPAWLIRSRRSAG